MRGLILQDLIKSCERVAVDVAKLHAKLIAGTTKRSIQTSAKILKFHVDRLINNRARGTRLIVRTTDGKPVASITDLG